MVLNLYAAKLFGLVYATAYLCAENVGIQKYLPNTPTRTFASKCVSWCHSNLVATVCFYEMLTCEYGGGCRDAIVNVFRISLTYFVMDTAHLVYIQKWNVIFEKFLYHHIVAMMLLYIGASRTVVLYTPSVLYYFWTVEASNVLLPVWDIARVNRLTVFQALTRGFLATYIPLRFMSFTHATWAVYKSVLYVSVGPHSAKVGALALTMLVNVFSFGFSVLIVKKYGRLQQLRQQ